MNKKKLIEKNEISPEIKHSLKKRVITGLIFAAIAIPCIVIGNWAFFVFVLALTIISAYELVHITKIEGKLRIVIYVAVITLLVFLTYFIFFRNNWTAIKNGIPMDAWDFVFTGFTNLEVSSMLIIVAAIIFFWISFATEKFTLFYVFYFITMIVIMALGFQSFLYLRFSPFDAWKYADASFFNRGSFPYLESLLLVLYVAIGTLMNDTGAYFVGILFGKHKMNERISPKKTWEGFVGGIVISAIFSFVFALILALTGNPILPRFAIDQQFYFVPFISIMMPLAGDIGDFVFSSIKRNAGIKDFSNLLPGHGGMLDRIDSLLFSCGSVAAMIALLDFISPIIENIKA